jgi:hypothetical protein
MKKMILAAVASMAVAAPAYAQTVGDSSSAYGTPTIDIPLSGTLAKSCALSAYLNGPFNALNMTSTAVQGSESVSAICNYGGSATVSFASANLGNMKSGTNLVPYKLLVSGSPFSAGVSLATPQSITGWPAVANAVQTRSLSVQLDTAATIAGTYTDTITASVTPN